MFVFIVPFKSRDASSNWQMASQLCGNAIRSMLSNPSPEVRVILVCSEIPNGLPEDPRLIVRSVCLPPPRTQYEKMTDKYLKFKAGLALSRQFAPMWLMRADADDLVSRRLVGFISQQDPDQLWFSEYGWRHSMGSRFVIKQPDFHLYCGTSSVAYATPDDLPRSEDDPSKDYYLLQTSHTLLVDQRRALGISVRPIPFPTTIYIMNSGENWSGDWALSNHGRRTRLKLALNMRPITPGLRREFGLTANRSYGTTP